MDRSNESPGRTRGGLRASLWVARLLVVAAPLTLWQYAVDRGLLAAYIVSSPRAIWSRFWSWLLDGTIAENLGHTLFEAALGYLLGVVLGAGLAVAFVARPRIGRVYLPFMTTLNAVPRLAFAPLFVAWLGFGYASKVALVVAVIMYVNFFAVYDGLRDIDEDYQRWVSTLGASPTEVWLHVRLPAIVMWVLGSLRLSAGFAIGAAVVGEFVGASRGIGYLVSRGANLFRSSDVFAGLIALVIVVTVFDAFLRLAERRFAHWIA